MAHEPPAAPALEAILEPTARLRELEPGLLSVLDRREEGAPYDRKAAAYDRLVSWRTYSRIAWGVDPARYPGFIARALASRSEGWAVDVAAGSCVASAAAYLDGRRPVVVLDRSAAMLRHGLARVREIAGELPRHVAFLQADATALPFRTGAVSTVLSHGAFHVFDESGAVCAEWARVLAPGGSLYVTSLVRGRGFGDAYLKLLRRAGEIAPPRSAEEFGAAIRSFWEGEPRVEREGNFAFLTWDPVGPARAVAAATQRPGS